MQATEKKSHLRSYPAVNPGRYSNNWSDKTCNCDTEVTFFLCPRSYLKAPLTGLAMFFLNAASISRTPSSPPPLHTASSHLLYFFTVLSLAGMPVSPHWTEPLRAGSFVSVCLCCAQNIYIPWVFLVSLGRSKPNQTKEQGRALRRQSREVECSARTENSSSEQVQEG